MMDDNEEIDETEQSVILTPEDVAEVINVLPIDEDDDGDDMEIDMGIIDTDPGVADDPGFILDDSVEAFTEHQEPVYSIAISPSNSLIVLSGGGNDQSFIWRMDTAEKLYDLPPHSDSVAHVKFSNDGKFAASASMDGKIHVVITDNGSLAATLEGPNEVTWIDWHPRGTVLLAGGADGSLWMWALPAGICMKVFMNHTASVTCGSFTPDGKNIVSASEDKSFILWDPKTGTVITKITTEDVRFHQNVITAMEVYRDSTLVLSGDSDGSARLVHLGNGRILGALENHSDSIETVGFCDSMPWAAAGSVDGSISIWDIQTLRLRSALRHDDAVTSIRWHPNYPLLYSASADKTVRLWDTRTGKQEKIWKGHQAPILTMDISKDGNRIVTGSDDGSALVFAFDLNIGESLV